MKTGQHIYIELSGVMTEFGANATGILMAIGISTLLICWGIGYVMRSRK